MQVTFPTYNLNADAVIADKCKVQGVSTGADSGPTFHYTSAFSVTDGRVSISGDYPSCHSLSEVEITFQTLAPTGSPTKAPTSSPTAAPTRAVPPTTYNLTNGLTSMSGHTGTKIELMMGGGSGKHLRRVVSKNPNVWASGWHLVVSAVVNITVSEGMGLDRNPAADAAKLVPESADCATHAGTLNVTDMGPDDAHATSVTTAVITMNFTGHPAGIFKLC